MSVATFVAIPFSSGVFPTGVLEMVLQVSYEKFVAIPFSSGVFPTWYPATFEAWRDELGDWGRNSFFLRSFSHTILSALLLKEKNIT